MRTVPKDEAERGQCIEAVTAVEQAEDVPIPVASAVTNDAGPARDAYVAALDASEIAEAAVITASRNVALARKAFRKALREWGRSVVDDEWKTQPREVARLLGAVPSEVSRLSPREQAVRMKSLTEKVAEAPHLGGDLTKLAAATAAMTDVTAAVTRRTSALTTRKTAKKAAAVARRTFRKAWLRLAGLLLEAGAPLADLVPVFAQPAAAHDEDGDEDEDEGEDEDEDQDDGEEASEPPASTDQASTAPKDEPAEAKPGEPNAPPDAAAAK